MKINEKICKKEWLEISKVCGEIFTLVISELEDYHKDIIIRAADETIKKGIEDNFISESEISYRTFPEVICANIMAAFFYLNK